MTRQVRCKRIYLPPERSDGRRVLVERLWPRGVSRERAAIDAWPKSVAPSNALRRWYGHDPRRWPTFRQRYLDEIRDNPAVAELLASVDRGPMTLVYAARDEPGNGAQVLTAYLNATRRRL
ncbi:MAG: DUF488 family protein [Gammaproteobacteria bacterium]|nr:DUF488 family protein [Gammaproteobacteria bacterium]